MLPNHNQINVLNEIINIKQSNHMAFKYVMDIDFDKQGDNKEIWQAAKKLFVNPNGGIPYEFIILFLFCFVLFVSSVFILCILIKV